ncbi:division plane positioning ATPase MipZ [Parvularcula marina]|uniref:ATPase n=1 Tax=Parvularcula marina TaxID=2292771 RepID=A0A371RLJ6_9PROT|nr:division plane positioning ATPase MipZ [Parvularcula marina]RFB06342.1 ATPase [Parvularcula marina]
MTHVIVVGNEKGGSGKTTVAMHLIVALLKSGKKVGCLDLDLRQKSLWRYLENRAKWGVLNELSTAELPMPVFLPIQGNQHDSRYTAKKQETEEFGRTLLEFANCDFLVIDTPGADTHLSRLAHMHADTIVTPLNDSFIDYDMLAQIDPETGKIKGPSLYAEVVWSARQHRASAGLHGGIDWLVVRNRMSATRSLNKAAVGERITELSKRIQFRTSKGFGERVIYRELFTSGMTLLDLGTRGAPRKFGSMSHLAARNELRGFLAAMNLPAMAREAEAA